MNILLKYSKTKESVISKRLLSRGRARLLDAWPGPAVVSSAGIFTYPKKVELFFFVRSGFKKEWRMKRLSSIIKMINLAIQVSSLYYEKMTFI